MPRFQDYAIARFVVCCNEHVAPAVPNGLQNAILRRGRYKQGSCRRQERTCREMLIASPRAEPGVFRTQSNFARRFLAARADVPW